MKIELSLRDLALIVSLGFCAFMGYQNQKVKNQLVVMQEQSDLHEKVLNAMVKQITSHEEMLSSIADIFKALMNPENAPSDEMKL